MISTLGRYDVVVPMEIERALSAAMETEQVVPRTIGIARRLHHLVCEPEVIQLQANALHAGTVVITRWILTGDADEVFAKSQEGFLVGIESLLQNEAEFH